MTSTQRVDRVAVVVRTLRDEPAINATGGRVTPTEWLAAIETMRRVVCGGAAATGRLQGILEIAQRAPRCGEAP